MLAELCEVLEPRYPGLQLEPIVLSKSPAIALIGESLAAEMLVVGYQGMGTFGGLHTGAVSRQVANQASCPVVVTRNAERPDGPVVVTTGPEGDAANGILRIVEPAKREPAGPADSPDVADAMRFAFAEASRREVALYAFQLSADTALSDELPDETFSGLLSEWQGRYPAVQAEGQCVARTQAVDRLLTATQHAGLLVVGTPGTGHGRGMRLGRLPSTLLSSASCPVAVVETSS